MHELALSRPVVTVATIVARGEVFLVVLETTDAGLRFNQPAGHLEPGETLVDAAVRETLEETGHHVRPVALVGIYRWQAPESGATFVRFAFAAELLHHDAERTLDDGIVAAHWLAYDELVACRERHRSPLVLRCVDDYRAGRRHALDLITECDGTDAGAGARS
jgi:8-oxo-dGTP pyrophosphatase MutT (NUDIX family)